jgi:hypothetical protein
MQNLVELKNFRRIRGAIDTAPFLREISIMEHLWEENKRRQTHISVQRETNTIFLRQADRWSEPHTEVNEIQATVATAQAAAFPHAMNFLEGFAAVQHAQLQRVLLVRLMPGGRVYPHIDRGSYYARRDRYHFVIVSPAGSRLFSGDEVVTMRPGELWWFNNKLRHEALNDGDDWRIHLIFDLLPMEVQPS